MFAESKTWTKPFFSNNSKTKADIKKSESSYVVQHDEIYLLCDFRDDPWNELLSFFTFLSNFSTLTFDNSKTKADTKILRILSRSARRDLSVVRLSWRSVKQCRSYCSFNVVFSYFSTLTFNSWKV